MEDDLLPVGCIGIAIHCRPCRITGSLVQLAIWIALFRMVASPWPHQRSGARWLLGSSWGCSSDEMGLGKGLRLLLAARALMRLVPLQLMVVAPVGLHPHWRREADPLDLSSSPC